MTAVTIEKTIRRGELSVPRDLVIEADEKDEYFGRGLYGHTRPDGSRIMVGPERG